MNRQKRRQSGNSNGQRALSSPKADDGSQALPADNLDGYSALLRRYPWFFGLFLVVATIFAYQPAWHAGFIWDDDFYVTNNPLLTAPDGLRRIWFSLDSPSQYFPLTYTIFRIQHGLWGLTSAGYHWFNILLHAVNALLVWRLLQRLCVPGAWLAAAIFALHPIQVESVAWVTELKNVLSLFLILLTLLAWLEFIEEQSKPSWRWYLLALGCAALALTAKTTACTLPAALLLILWLKYKPVNWLRLIQVVPFMMMGVGMGLLTMWWERHINGTHGKLFAFSLPDRLLVASHAFWFYFGKLIWPVNLTFSYPRWIIQSDNPFAYGWTVAAVLLGAMIYFLRRFTGRGPEVAALFFVVTLGPLLGFIMLYTFRYTFVADHYQYVACIGPIALAAAGISRALGIWGKERPMLKPVMCGALLLLLGALTWRQCRMYADAETLWRATIDRNPASWMAHIHLGIALHERGEDNEAIIQFQEAIRLNASEADAYINLGDVLVKKGQVDEAINLFQKAISLESGYPEAHYNLGVVLLGKGQTDTAISHLQEAILLKPDYTEAHYNLGVALYKRGRTDEAISHLQEAIRLKSDYALAHNSLGIALLNKGQTDKAMSQFQDAIRFKPDYADAYNNLGIALGMQSRIDEAISQFQEAVRLKPDFVNAQSNLVRALELKKSSKQSGGH